MPYKVYAEGDKECVHKLNADGSKGDVIKGGCHPKGDGMAQRQMKALYASEKDASKEISTAETPDSIEQHEKGIGPDINGQSGVWVPMGMTSFAAYDEWCAAQEMTKEVAEDTSAFSVMVQNIMWDENVTDKATAVKELADEFSARIGGETDMADYEDEQSTKEVTKSEKDGKHPASHYLIVEDPQKPTTWHLRVKNKAGKIDHRLMTDAWDALHKNFRGKPYAGPNKAEAIKKLSALYKSENIPEPSANKEDETFLQRVKEAVSNIFGIAPKEEKSDGETMMLWKEANGQYRWFARYSNNRRDNDRPSEILAKEAHENFVRKVDEGLYPMPTLQLWHRKEWEFGIADWVAYDDAGFALASGTVKKGFEPVAEELLKIDPMELAVSHGMPIQSLVRDTVDKSVIKEYQTTEISVLPARAAANKLTGFLILSEDETTKEGSMTVPVEKKEELKKMGVDPAVLDSLEKANAQQAKEADAAGIESKEKKEDVAAAAPAETAAPQTGTTPTQEEKPLTRQEVAEAIVPVVQDVKALKELVATLTTTVETLTKEIGKQKETDTARVEKAIAGTPAASLSALIARSVIGNPETRVDGRSELGKSKPKETNPDEGVQSNANLPGRIINNILKEASASSTQQAS